MREQIGNLAAQVAAYLKNLVVARSWVAVKVVEWWTSWAEGYLVAAKKVADLRGVGWTAQVGAMNMMEEACRKAMSYRREGEMNIDPTF